MSKLLETSINGYIFKQISIKGDLPSVQQHNFNVDFVFDTGEGQSFKSQVRSPLIKQHGRSNEKTNQEIDDVISSNILYVKTS